MVLRTLGGGCPYGVGKYIFTDDANFNPNSTYKNTTWERVKGRVLAGVDESDSDFNTVGKTGGYKTSPQISSVRANDGFQLNSAYWKGKGLVGPIENTTGSAMNSGVSLLQPYQTCYIWTRIK